MIKLLLLGLRVLLRLRVLLWLLELLKLRLSLRLLLGLAEPVHVFEGCKAASLWHGCGILVVHVEHVVDCALLSHRLCLHLSLCLHLRLLKRRLLRLNLLLLLIRKEVKLTLRCWLCSGRLEWFEFLLGGGREVKEIANEGLLGLDLGLDFDFNLLRFCSLFLRFLLFTFVLIAEPLHSLLDPALELGMFVLAHPEGVVLCLGVHVALVHVLVR